MRVRTAVAVAGLAVGTALVSQRAAAQESWSGCSPGTLNVCSAFYASTVQQADGWHLYLRVWNLYTSDGTNGLSHVITYVGIGGNWSGTASLVSAEFNGNPISGWSTAKSINKNPVGAELGVAGQTDNGVNQGLVGCGQAMPPGEYPTCYPGTYLELNFLTGGEFKFADASGNDVTVFGWHSQSVAGTKCSLWADSKGNSTGSDLTLGDCTGVVPEPVTMTLLATGLAGMGGVGFIRRRRRGLQDDGRAV